MDEQGRLFLAIALSFLVFAVWGYFFSESDQGIPQNTVKTEKQESEPGTKNELEKTDQTVINPNVKEQVQHERQAENLNQNVPARNITISTPLYSVIISESGAKFVRFSLKEYRESIAVDSDEKAIISGMNKVGSLVTTFNENTEHTYFKANLTNDSLNVSNEAKKIEFIGVSDGIQIKKVFTFLPDSYRIQLDIAVVNFSSKPANGNFSISLSKLMGKDVSRIGFEGPCGLIDNALEKIDVKDLEEKDTFKGTIKWAAIQDRYFISSIIPKKEESAKLHVTKDIIDNEENAIIHNKLIFPEISMGINESESYSFDIFFGPKSLRLLDHVGYDLNKAVDFGIFSFIAKPCLTLMNLIHDYVFANYGVAIILLTILIKIILWPLGTKSYKSMNEMKKLQPLMEEIREKYKNDKKKMNEELMGLYKTYRINPLGGCLPMIAQIPVFFALYQMLYGAIELRHAPFFGWINDLSAPDRLGNFDFSIPFMEAPTGIPVLTIIMGATMLLQQKLSPPPGDPAQAKMMMFMPIIFTVIFINFSSGLVLYWLVQNTLSIAQQYYTSKK